MKSYVWEQIKISISGLENGFHIQITGHNLDMSWFCISFNDICDRLHEFLDKILVDGQTMTERDEKED